jgi:3-hydroxyisobutyrate dehydrogenase-like beta-hydroxyacid dehydrogenase
MSEISKPAVIGVLGLGHMGSGVAAALKDSGFDVVSTVEGRSERTRGNAARAGVRLLPTLGDVVAACDTFLSIVAADQAEPLAEAVASAANGRSLHFVECNAITPSKTLRIAERVQAAGLTFSDGGIIGSPPSARSKPRLYVSGPASDVLVALKGERLAVVPLGDSLSQATEMKVLFAAANKGATALLVNILAAAKRVDLLDRVVSELDGARPGLLGCVRGAGPTLADKAARWAIEMEDLSASLTEMHAHGGYHAAAAEGYRQLAENFAATQTDGDALDRVLDAWIGPVKA